MQPSALMVIAFLGVGSLSAILFLTYQRTSVFPEKTKKEISEMNDRMKIGMKISDNTQWNLNE